MRATDVFLSSTCYDLGDLRAELAEYLNRHSFVVRLSEDCDSSFAVNATVDSIESCLINIAQSDVVVCILDRRYGPSLPAEHRYAGKSATHAELARAWELRKPVLAFVREATLNESIHRKSDTSFRTKWIEERSADSLAQLVDNVKSLGDALETPRSNWFDTFKTSVDLKPRVLKRLLDCFPAHVAAYARRGDRIVRLYLVIDYSWQGGTVQVRAINAGVGPAVDVSIGRIADGTEATYHNQGGLQQGGESNPTKVEIPLNRREVFVAVNYSNVWGDKYRVRQRVVYLDQQRTYTPQGPEKFEVDVQGEWREI